MVQQILVYNLNEINLLIKKKYCFFLNLLGSHSSSAYAASDALENDI
jgi:hypothetical protein